MTSSTDAAIKEHFCQQLLCIIEYTCSFNHFGGAFISMSVVEGLKIQIHVCGTYVLSVWFTLLIGFGSVWIFSRRVCEGE